MKKIRFIVAAVLILMISLTTYIFLKKQPVENVPNRATLVMQQNNTLDNKEVIR
jgi:hypothetical protein